MAVGWGGDQGGRLTAQVLWKMTFEFCWLLNGFELILLCLHYVPIWLLLVSPIKTISIDITYFTHSLDCCLSPECYLPWESPGALHTHILNPLEFYSCTQTCGQNASPLYPTKQLSASIQSQAPPAQKRRVVQCVPADPSAPSFQDWTLRLGHHPKAEGRESSRGAGEGSTAWCLSLLSLVGSNDVHPAATSSSFGHDTCSRSSRTSSCRAWGGAGQTERPCFLLPRWYNPKP